MVLLHEVSLISLIVKNGDREVTRMNDDFEVIVLNRPRIFTVSADIINGPMTSSALEVLVSTP